VTLSVALRDQARSCAALESPFMARMLPILSAVWPYGSALDRSLGRFSGDIGPKGHSLPLRLASGLHALVLTRQDDALIAAYPPNAVGDATLKSALRNALAGKEDFLIEWIQSPPQTNEVRRSAVLIAGAHALAHRTGVSRIKLSELGASAGLNLMFDRFALLANGARIGPVDASLTLAPDWTGAAPVAADVRIIDRRGVDLNPLDPHDSNHALRLRAYLWADQAHRKALTDAAIAAHTATVDQGDAIKWLGTRLGHACTGEMHLIFNTIAWQYFPPDRQVTGTALIEAAGAQATPDSPVAWLRMEADADRRGASITARLWPGNHHIPLGRADFHGRWVDWTTHCA
jgi:hypothetical protein